ncbi:Hyaluronan/mRNA-binding protein [Fusarium oxysporum f. sp. vasinfectum]|nr:Hyaluronan/mRNA-binding protein [Fusarium oxysporum f. sp. vasinfectum]
MSVVTKNPFAYLGNDSDGEEKPVVPVKTVDKNTARTTKRNVEPQAPVRAGGAGGNRRGPGGNEGGAFRDRGAGSNRNQNRSTEEAPRDGPRGGAGARVRGGRGARHARERDDRHPSKFGGHGGSDKQAAQSWGANEGTAELKDEQAGEAIAKDEQKDAVAEDAAAEAAAAEEEAEKQVSYEEYLAQQAEKKAALDSGLKVREANEGSKLDKKWANAKPLENEEEEYFAPTGGKAQRQRERKVKQTIDFDPRFGSAKGNAAINTSDQSAFPSLGGN